MLIKSLNKSDLNRADWLTTGNVEATRVQIHEDVIEETAELEFISVDLDKMFIAVSELPAADESQD